MDWKDFYKAAFGVSLLLGILLLYSMFSAVHNTDLAFNYFIISQREGAPIANFADVAMNGNVRLPGEIYAESVSLLLIVPLLLAIDAFFAGLLYSKMGWKT